MKKALITGITGQDGSYLAEFLLNKGYEVHGIKRRTSLIRIIQEIQPDKIYNLAAQSHVAVSFEQLVKEMIHSDLKLAKSDQLINS